MPICEYHVAITPNTRKHFFFRIFEKREYAAIIFAFLRNLVLFCTKAWF